MVVAQIGDPVLIILEELLELAQAGDTLYLALLREAEVLVGELAITEVRTVEGLGLDRV